MLSGNIYSSKSDEDLLKLLNYSKAAEHEFYRRYRIKTAWFIKNYKMSQLEREDIIQEGMIGLFYAVDTFKEEKEIKFSTYASVCIRNRINNALQRLWRIKKQTDGSQDVEDIVISSDPLDDVLLQEVSSSLEQAVLELDEMEKTVLALYLDKKSYQDIAKELAISTKKVDNILMKLKSKLASRVSHASIDFSSNNWNQTLRDSFHRGLQHED